MIQDVLSDWLNALTPAPKRIWIAYSGGRDSHTLLHALKSHPSCAHPVLACHVDHRLSPHSDAWAQHCEATTLVLDVPFYQHTLSTAPPRGDSIEAWARTARYQWFESLLEHGDILCTAHNQSDQAETVLMNLTRGSGLKGLCGIAALKRLGKGQLARPLLNVPRHTIDAYVQTHQLHYIEDDSNQNPKFERNYIRHQCIPFLQTRYPSLTTTLARTAKHCLEASRLLDELAVEDLKSISSPLNHIKVAGLAKLTHPRQKNVLRFWLQSCGFPMPSEVKLDDILKQVIEAKIDRHPKIQWGDVILRRVKGDILVSRLAISLPS